MRKRSNDEHLNDIYNKRKSELNAKIITEKRQHYSNIIRDSDNKTKMLWSLANEKVANKKKKMHTDITITHNNSTITDSYDQANLFADYLSTIVDKQLKDHFKGLSSECTKSKPFNKTMYFAPVTENDVEKVIRQLKLKKASGIDDVPSLLVKICSQEIVSFLTHMINMSLCVGKFPTRLKVVALLPIYKKADETKLENYRPIALLSIFSKIIEKVISNKIMEFLNKYNLITSSQDGFRSGYSTKMASTSFVQIIYDNIDKNNVAELFLDLSRALDTIDPTFM